MAGSIGEAFVVVRPDTRGFKGEADRSIGGAMRGVAGTVAKGSLLLGGALAAGAGVGILKVGLGLVNLKEQAQIGFTTMFENAAKAEGNMKAFGRASQDASAFIADMQSFAAKTPFEFPELIQASQRLMAMGFAAKDVKPTLTAVGDAVAALGGNSETVGRVTTALGQIQAKGRASADEMLQLTQAGIPAWQMLADKIGVSIPEAMKMAEKGQIDATTTIGALTEGMNAKFGGMMAKQSTTLAGLWSTAKDTAAQAAASIVEPFAPAIKGALGAVSGLLADPAVQEGLASFGQTVADGVGGAVEFATQAWAQFGPTIMGAVQTAMPVVMALWDGLKQRIDLVVAAGQAIFDAFGEVFAFFQSEGASSGEAVGALTTALEAVQTVVQTVAQIAGEAWGQFTAGVRAHGDEFRGIMTDVRSIAQDVARFLVAIWPPVQAVIRTVFQAAGTIILGVLRVVRQVVAGVAALLNGDWSAAWQAAKNIVTIAIQTAVAVFQTIVRNLGPYAATAARAAAEAIRTGLAALPGIIQSAALSAASKIISAGPGWAAAAVGAAIRIVTSVAQGLVGLAPRVGALLAQIPGLLAAAAGAAAGAALSIGSAIVDGILSGASSLGSRLASYISDQIRNALSHIDIPGFSPVDEAAEEAIGHPIVRGAVKGVDTLGRRLGGALQAQVRDAIGQAASAASSAASGLAGTIGEFIDAGPAGPAQRELDALHAAQRKKERDALAATMADTTASMEDRRAAMEKLREMDLEAAAEAEAKKREDAKANAERSLADLDAAARRGLITQKEYQERVKKILADAGISYRAAGDRLGFAFAETFRVQVETLQRQVGALLGSLGFLRGATASIGVDVTRPGEVIRQARSEATDRLRDANRRVREAQSELKKADTEAERKKAQRELDAARKAQEAADRQVNLLTAILRALAAQPSVNVGVSADPLALWAAVEAA